MNHNDNEALKPVAYKVSWSNGSEVYPRRRDAEAHAYALSSNGWLNVKTEPLCSVPDALSALQAHEAEVKELVEALEMALQIGDGCSRGALGAFQQQANAILAKVKP